MAQRRRDVTIMSLFFVLILAFAVLGAIDPGGGGGGSSTLKQAFTAGDGTIGQVTAVKPFRLEGCTTETLDWYCDVTDGWVQVSSTSGGIKSPMAATTNIVSANYTLGTDDDNELYGGIITVDTAATITVPAVVDGMNFTVVTEGATAVSVDMDAADRMILLSVATLDDGDKATNNSTEGDSLTCWYESAAGFYCKPSGTWTDGGPDA